MKKLLYFTEAQVKLMDKLKRHHKMNNSEVVREALKEYALKYNFEIPENYEAKDVRGWYDYTGKA